MLFAGTTRCTGCNTKYPSKLELVLWWVFIINCNVVTPLHCRPQPTVPNKAGLSKCLQEQSVNLVGNVPPDLRTDEALVWFSRSPKSKAKKPVRQARCSQSNLYPLNSFIFSSCFVGASFSSSRSSRRVSPGQAADPDRSAPSNPVCGAVWMSSARAGPEPFPPETQDRQVKSVDQPHHTAELI